MHSHSGLAALSSKIWDEYKMGLPDNPDLDMRTLADARTEYESAREKSVRGSSRRLGKRSRLISFLKWAPIPALAVALIFLLDPFGGSGVAWGKVMERVEQAPTTIMRGATYLRGEDKELKPFFNEWTAYYSKEFGAYYEARTLGKISVQTYISPDRTLVTIINPQTGEKKSVPLGEPESGSPRITDPKKFIRSYFSHPYKKIGKQTINGVLAEGIEYRGDTDPDDGAPKLFPNQKIYRRLWVSLKTGLPIRREDIYTMPYGEQVNISDMEWNVPLPKSLFQIPETKTAPAKK